MMRRRSGSSGGMRAGAARREAGERIASRARSDGRLGLGRRAVSTVVIVALSAVFACVPGGAATAGAGDAGVRGGAGGSGGGSDPGARDAASAAETRSGAEDAAVRVLSRGLGERIASVSERSPTWRAAMEELRRGSFRVIVGEPADVRRGVTALSRYRIRHFGEVVPLRDSAGALSGAVVVVDVERVRRLVERADLPERVLEADVERILIHELYGHVVPLARSRRLDGGCPDPGPGDPPLSSCAIRRENRIRAELGLEPRVAYDLSGLAVGRYLRGMGLDGLLRARDPR